jgi:hypothetical protein
MKFPKVGEFTLEDLTDWLNSLDIHTSVAILEKLYKDLRDFAIAHHIDAEEQNEK